LLDANVYVKKKSGINFLINQVGNSIIIQLFISKILTRFVL
jgi:hypothetical protein